MRRYLEDLQVGDTVLSHRVTLSEVESLDFARRYDPQPMHTDPRAAAGPFHGLIASGWHTAALMMRMIVDADPLGGGEILGVGVDQLRWPAPVRPGDTLQTEVNVGALRPSQSNPNFGVVRLDVTVRNRNGEVVLTANPNCWVPRRSQE